MKVFITIIAGIIAFAAITALTAAAFAVIFCIKYVDVVQSVPFVALAIFFGIPTGCFVASELYDKDLPSFN